jgi:hypothetical protein
MTRNCREQTVRHNKALHPTCFKLGDVRPLAPDESGLSR